MKEIYRLRSIDALLNKFNELEEQTIYFASSDELNDPMEGYLNYFWDGDSIAWINLLRHFIIGLGESLLYKIVGGSLTDSKFHVPIVLSPVFQRTGVFKTDEHKEMYESICSAFLHTPEVINFIKYILTAKYKIRYLEILLYFELLNSTALECVLSSFAENNLIDIKIMSVFDFKKNKPDFFEILSEIPESERTPENLEALSLTVRNFQLAVGFHHDQKMIEASNIDLDDIRFLLIGYSQKFLEDLKSIIFPPWYTACFMGDFINPSVWGHYAQGHNGACLIFKINEDQYKVGLFPHPETRNNKTTLESFDLYPIKYVVKHNEIDFFRSIGPLPMSVIINEWFQDEEGNHSICAQPLKDDALQWRKNYWKNCIELMTTKLLDWNYENEFRLIIMNDFYDYTNPLVRKFKYDFNSLAGIIFGVKVIERDRRRMIKILRDKCKASNRSDFKFYQAYYDDQTGKIARFELTLLT